MPLQFAQAQDEFAVRAGRPMTRARLKNGDARVAELFEALQQAEAERDSRTAFLSYVVQELRTPLTAVVGIADLLKESQLSADQRDMIGIMRRNAEHLVGLVTNALDLTRLDAGKVVLEHRPFEPLACVEESLELVSAAAAEKGVDLAYAIHESTPARLTGDSTRVRQVLVHLLNNAVKFTDAGQVIVRVSAGPLAAGLHEVRVSVSDSGAGIPTARLDQIFGDFTEMDSTSAGRGNGLGLSIARRLVHLMGGRMWVESDVGRGSTFHFTVVAEAAGGESLLAGSDQALIGRRVLIVDSNAAVTEILSQTIKRWGLRVSSAADANEGLRRIASDEAYDLVLVDGRLPDRREFTSAIRKIPGAEALPLVLLTTMGSRGLDESLAGTGGRARFAAYLSKPVRLARLHETLVRILCASGVQPRPAVVRMRPSGPVSIPGTAAEPAASGSSDVEAVLIAMAQCMESRDPHTHGHCGRLADYATRLGHKLGLDPADIDALRLGGIVHDIGKVAIPDAILFKPGPLTESEWTVMREHTIEGERICGGLAAFQHVLPIIRHHHEKLDGTGYPDGLRGGDIPVTARILQVVDIYDALTTTRAYKPAMPPAHALEVLQGEVDRGWRDEFIVRAFRELVLEDLEAVA